MRSSTKERNVQFQLVSHEVMTSELASIGTIKSSNSSPPFRIGVQNWARNANVGHILNTKHGENGEITTNLRNSAVLHEIRPLM